MNETAAPAGTAPDAALVRLPDAELVRPSDAALVRPPDPELVRPPDAALVRLLDHVSEGVLLCDDTATVRYLNAAAAAMLPAVQPGDPRPEGLRRPAGGPPHGRCG